MNFNENNIMSKNFNKNYNIFFNDKNLENEINNINKDNYKYNFNFDKIDESILKKTIHFISLLKNPKMRDFSLKNLNKLRDNIINLAGLLWHSIGTIAILLQEIISIYPYLNSNKLSEDMTERICNILGLFQCISLDNDIRPLFLKANLPFYLYPLINSPSKEFEHIKVISLGVIGALVKYEDPFAINFLMKTELIVYCLRIMKNENYLSKTVSTFIVQKILLDKNGLEYICEQDERIFAICQIWRDMILEMNENVKIDERLFRHIIRCFLRLSENIIIIPKILNYIPTCIINKTIEYNDKQIIKWHNQLVNNIQLSLNSK